MKKLLLIIYLLTMILLPYPVFAKTPDIVIDNIEFVDKGSNTVILNEPSYNHLDINFDVEFNHVNDFVKYKVIVKNNDNDNYKIKNNFEDQSNYITYELEMDNDNLDANSSKEIIITITYKTAYYGDTVLNETQTLTILTEDNEVIPVEENKTITEVINNVLDTFKGKNVPINILGILLILGGCFLIFKHANILAIFLFLLVIPTYTYAQEELSINFNSKITIHGESIVDITMFDEGRVVNRKMKILAGDTEGTYASNNTTITAIKKSDTSPNLSEMGEDNIVSISSTKPIYMWFDSGTIYWYSPDSTVYYNSDSRYFYGSLTKVSVIEDLEDINTSKLTNMAFMFYSTGSDTESFNMSNINNWDLSQVTTMFGTFLMTGVNATTWSIGDLSNWNTSNIKIMSSTFTGCCKKVSTCDIGNLDNWDTSNVINMSQMFFSMGYYSTSWNIGNISNWNTSNVTDFSKMFGLTAYNVETFNIGNLDNWDTSNVTNMSQMFMGLGYSAAAWNIGNLSNWDTSKVKNFDGMFDTAGYNATSWEVGDISHWNTSSATNMQEMFGGAGQYVPNFDLDLSGWDTSNVTNMKEMFRAAGQHSNTWILRGVSNWDTSKVTDMSDMFAYAGGQSTSFQLDISNWNTSSVTDITNIFSAVGQHATTWNIIIPRTNGNGIENTTDKIYGSTTDVYYSTYRREFTLATE